MTADVGDIVKVPKQEPDILAAARTKKGSRLVRGTVIHVSKAGSYPLYTVELETGGTQRGNGHMIREVIERMVKS